MPKSFNLASPSLNDSDISGSHHRRRSSSHIKPLNLHPSTATARKGRRDSAASSSVPVGAFGLQSAPLPAVPSTPSATGQSPMSLSRSPSPRPGGGWSSPGLTTGTTGSSRASSPRHSYGDLVNNNTYSNGVAGPGGVSWAAAKAKSDRVKGYPSFSTRNNGFFSRQRRKISASLPRFRVNNVLDYGEKEKLGRGRWAGCEDQSLFGRVVTLLGNLLRRTRIRFLLISILVFVFWIVLARREFSFSLSFPLFLLRRATSNPVKQLLPNHIEDLRLVEGRRLY